MPCFYICNEVEHKTSYVLAKRVVWECKRDELIQCLLVRITWCFAYSVHLEAERCLSCLLNLVNLLHVVPSVHSRQPIAALNQQNAQCSSSDIYIITMSIPTCCSPHGILIRKKYQRILHKN